MSEELHSENEYENLEEEESVSEFDEKNKQIKNNYTSNSNISNLSKTPSDDFGNGNLHFLPAKISHTGPCRVDVFFDTLIQMKNKNSNISETKQDQENKVTDCSTSFRGRIFNGKKIQPKSEFQISHLKMNNQGNKLIINSKKELESYYIWKYDEIVAYNNNFSNMDRIMKNLDVLN
jgi:hypothetical protein